MGGYLGDPRGREAAVEARQGRDDFSFEDRRAGRSMGGAGYDRGPGATRDADKDVAPVSRIEMYLDETPALQSQIDYSAAANKAAADKAAAERARTMGATMGGGPSYDPLVTGEEDFPDYDYNTEAEASSWPLELHANLRKMAGYEETKKGKHSGMHSARWHPDFATWSDAKQRDFLAGFDKTLGAAGRYSREKAEWEKRATEEEKQVIWNKVDQLVRQYSSTENLEKLMDAGYSMDQLTSILSDTSNLRDVIRHGIATNKFGLMKMTGYETFQSGQEWSDYKNNVAAYRFARTLRPDQDFDEEWASAVIQEKMNPGSTGITIDWKAGTEDEPTAGEVLEGWMKSFMDKLSGMQGDGGMITQAEQGGG